MCCTLEMHDVSYRLVQEMIFFQFLILCMQYTGPTLTPTDNQLNSLYLVSSEYSTKIHQQHHYQRTTTTSTNIAIVINNTTLAVYYSSAPHIKGNDRGDVYLLGKELKNRKKRKNHNNTHTMPARYTATAKGW